MSLEIAEPITEPKVDASPSPYAPPKSDISMPASFDDNGIDFKTLKKLRNHSTTIRAFGVLNCVPLVVFAFAALTTTDLLLNCGVFVGLVVAIYAALWRPSWGRAVGFVYCCILLFLIPVGTLFGILGLVAYAGAGRLFGEGRYTHKFLESEWKRRKKLKM